MAQHSQSNLSGKDILAQLKIGTRVVKGPDWKWGDQVKYLLQIQAQLAHVWHCAVLVVSCTCISQLDTIHVTRDCDSNFCGFFFSKLASLRPRNVLHPITV